MAIARYRATPLLKEEREKACTQEEMIELINTETGKSYARTFYTNIENSTRQANTEVALVICRILECKVSDLFTSIEASDAMEDPENDES